MADQQRDPSSQSIIAHQQSQPSTSLYKTNSAATTGQEHRDSTAHQPAQSQSQAVQDIGNNGATTGPAATTPFLDNFNLVAEAAKRAQMAVVMRDLESVQL